VSKSVNPMAIGGFLIGGLALLITALLVFGGGQLLKPKLHWVVYFDSSLNGLNVGAPVKVQGVQVGTVKEIVLQMDLKHNRLMKPVVLEIEPGSLVNPQGEALQPALTDQERHERLQRFIDAGLRARLEIQSLLTGLLYVDLNFYPNYEARLTGLNYKDYPEVPAIPTTVDEVKGALEEVVKKVKDMPLDSMVRDLSATLAEIRLIVASDETRQSRKALARTLLEAEQLLADLNRQLPPLVRDANQTVKEAGRMVKSLHAEAKPALAAARQSLLKASAMLDEAKGAMANLADTAAGDSALQESLVELRDAARSIRLLSDYLEQHPESLIYGKSQK
jgi:paraquat-inducible protein B